MSRIIAIDYGLKRTGLAVTDPYQIIATGLTTVSSKEFPGHAHQKSGRAIHFQNGERCHAGNGYEEKRPPE